MPAILPETRHTCQCAERLFRKFGHREISELTCNLPRVQKEAKVCRRNSSCNSGGLFLHIIGNQPVMLFRAELREIAPGVERCLAKENQIIPRGPLGWCD